jgi:DnaJ-class molecular chaperone
MSNDYVTCPACKGKKISCVSETGKCQCCNGHGQITRQEDEAKARLRKDLKRILLKNEPA